MTKRAHIEAQRTAPLGQDGLQAIRNILAGHSAAKVNEVFVDAFTASAIVNIYDAINEVNRAKLISFPVSKVAGICFSLINRSA